MRQYEITHHKQETACDNCGCPLYVGDTVYLSDDEARAYCSQFCVRAGERNNAPMAKPQPRGVQVGGWWI